MERYNLFNTLFFFNDTATTEIYTLSLHDALPISCKRQEPDCKSKSFQQKQAYRAAVPQQDAAREPESHKMNRSEEHTSELQSLAYLVCRLLLEKKNTRHLVTENLDPTMTATQTLF